MVRFPLEVRVLNRGAAEHIAAGLGAAADYGANFIPLYSPVDGKVLLFTEGGGGNWIRVTDSEGRNWEMAHLSERLVKTGDVVKAGQRIGTTGNTGTITTGPHLHLQVIKNGTRIDPVPLLANAPLANMPENHAYDNKLIRLPPNRNYALVVRGKKFVFPINDLNLQAFIVLLEKANITPVSYVDQATWDSLPNSDGLKF